VSFAPLPTRACAQETAEHHTSVVVPHMPATARALLGRNAELAVLDGVLDGARAGRGCVLVIRGEPGVGKSVLLDYVAEQASGCRLARAAGVESEAQLTFAGLQQLLGASMLERSEHLPAPQRDALLVVLGVQQGSTPDRFLVGLATLGLLSDVAEERPLVCLINDAQWLDRTSTDCQASSWRVSATTTRGGCWRRLCPDVWTSKCVTGSWPRRGAIPWPCWSYRVA
jgi:hypothetical protein